MSRRRSYPTIHDRPALHAFVRARLRPDGSLPDPACTLPDEAPRTPGRISWSAGAVDGVFGHHTLPAGQEPDRARPLAAAIAAAAERPHGDELRALYELVSADDVLSIIDPAIEALAALRPSTAAVARLGVWLASQSPDRGPVKVGMALLGISGAPDDSLLHELGAHEEFTLYAVVAFSDSRENPDADLFTLARRVHGWGRIHCVEQLCDTTDPEIRRWILTDGFRNGVMNEYLAHIAATTGGLAAALAVPSPDRHLLTAAGDIIDALLRGGPAENIDDYTDAPEVLARWLDHLGHHAETLADLTTTAAVRAFCDRDDWDRRLATGPWTAAARATVRDRAERLISDPRWPQRVLAGLDAPDPDEFRHAERGARLLGIDPFDHLLARIDADPLGGPWFEAWKGVDGGRARLLAERAARLLDLDRIASGPGTTIGLGPDFAAHAALGWSLQGIREHPGVGTDLVDAALCSPSTRNRHGALNVLEAWDPHHWTDTHRDRLRTMGATDPEDHLRARATELLERAPGRP
jgi:hypothetical protein